MNWLAHLFLSKQNIEYRVGNLLPDFLPITELVKFSQPFQEGITCHRIIDSFTDSHPIVKNSITRIPATYKRFGGILTDVFYDHFLAKNWD
jgi:acyl carrier protein phosphodiesterase